MSTDCVTESVPVGYKQTEVGVIPEDWDEVTFSEITSKIGDGIHATPQYSPNGDYFFINGNNIQNGHIVITKETKAVSTSEFKKYSNELSERTLLLSINGTIGNVALYSEEPIFLGKSAAFINVHKNVSKHFIFYLLQTASVISYFNEGLTGTTIKNLGLNTIRNTPVPIPSTLAEQEAIAQALTDADALIESLEQLIAKKRQIKQGAMQELLTGKRRLPGFNEEWEVKLLGDLFDFSGGLSASRDQLSTEGYCYLHYGDIHTSNKTYIDVTKEKQDIPKLDVPLKKVSSTSLLESGDVVFVDASEDDEGTSRHVVIFNEEKIPFISGLHTIVAKSKTNEFDHHYQRYCFQTNDVKQQFRFFAVGTKVSGISKANIVKITLPVPLIEEQKAIASIFSDMDEEISVLEEKLEKSRMLKQGMMQELLTGRIRLV